ncbi:DUF3558 family protein [Mycobacteroides abscessus]|uniref:DUF3558 family protein n=1 Tax=Mycobacteroides abscessus TaxID=36809 RepID=UPI0017844284|nr:DUF3558 family protein [Mycobacteroides abscessus]MBE5458373.1 hypothetical protein [Mycobacteroides abscessus]QOF45181.1 hypothetical protein E3G69_004239 [Mycobacteroides abscessus]QOF49879.1 hypothetical protein E3G70_004237 [Mycobacteroides abscessus]
MRVLIVTVSFVLAGCSGAVTGDPVVASVSDVSHSPIPTSTPLAGVSPPTTAAPNPNVTGTTFDGCASVTDLQITSWELDSSTKRDTKDSILGEGVRGCRWNGDKWFLRVYATNGSMAVWEKPQPQFDRQEKVQIGSRQGGTGHEASGCSAVVSSQQGLAVVQVDLARKLEREGFDACPLAVQIMTAIEPRIP